MTTCSLAVCKNDSKKTQQQNIVYHRFPKDPNISSVWVTNKCMRADKINTKNARICSEHFNEHCYEDMKNRLLELPGEPIGEERCQIVQLRANNNPEMNPEEERRQIELLRERLLELNPPSLIEIILDSMENGNLDYLRQWLDEYDSRLMEQRRASLQERIVTPMGEVNAPEAFRLQYRDLNNNSAIVLNNYHHRRQRFLRMFAPILLYVPRALLGGPVVPQPPQEANNLEDNIEEGNNNQEPNQPEPFAEHAEAAVNQYNGLQHILAVMFERFMQEVLNCILEIFRLLR